MKIGYHAPLPPAKTGVADYAAALLGALRRVAEVEIAPKRADVQLYHLGNNPLHREIYQRALAEPGVVVLHDAVLQHFFLGSLDERDYIEEFVYNYGEWQRDFAAELWRDRGRSAADRRYFDHPMLRRIAEKSRAIIVHNPGAAEMARRHAPRARIEEIPHLFAAPELPPACEVIARREELGIPQTAYVFGVFGYLRESKRLPVILRAFENVRRQVGNVRLLIAGAFASADLERALGLLEARPGVVRAGYMPDREFWRLALLVDACINLRDPAAGETSGISIRLMGIRKPVILSSGPETSRLPEEACVRVDSGLAEEEMLEEYMLWLARFPADGNAIGLCAAEYIGRHHSAAQVVERYWPLLRSIE